MQTKSVSIRMPLDLLDWLREKSARETIKHRKLISLNAYVVKVLQREMETDPEKGKV